MVHVLLKYPEIHTNLKFIHVSTLPLEFRAGTAKKEKSNMLRTDRTQNNVFNTIFDSAYTDNFITAKNCDLIEGLPQWRNNTYSERLTFQSVDESSLNVNKVFKFSLRPCELR